MSIGSHDAPRTVSGRERGDLDGERSCCEGVAGAAGEAEAEGSLSSEENYLGGLEEGVEEADDPFLPPTRDVGVSPGPEEDPAEGHGVHVDAEGPFGLTLQPLEEGGVEEVLEQICGGQES